MVDTPPGPITNQEINAAADRIAHDLVVYALSEIRDLLGDGIGETIADDQDAGRLDVQARGIVYGLVWDRLGGAAAGYQRRDQVLAEAAGLVLADAEAKYQRSYSDNRIFEFNGGKRARDVLLAARTTATQEG